MIDRLNHMARVNERELDLTAREFSLLDFFMRNQTKVFTAEQLLNHLWSADDDVGPDTVRAHVKHLRRKLEESGAQPQLQTVHGIGYRFIE